MTQMLFHSSLPHTRAFLLLKPINQSTETFAPASAIHDKPYIRTLFARHVFIICVVGRCAPVIHTKWTRTCQQRSACCISWLQRSKDFRPPVGTGRATTCSGEAFGELADIEHSDCTKDVPPILVFCAAAVRTGRFHGIPANRQPSTVAPI